MSNTSLDDLETQLSQLAPSTSKNDSGDADRKFTELGNAQRIAAKHGHVLRYVRSWRSWLAWDGTRWKRDELGVEVVVSKDIVRDLYADLAELAHQSGPDAADLAESLAKWAKQSAKRSTIENSAALAQTEPPIAAHAGSFDADPWLLNVQNGTVDLRTGQLRPHAQLDLITMLAPADYDPDAACPTWDAFVAWALPDPATRSWVQRFCGYCLTGDVGEQVATFLHGGGANGKSTFLGAVKHVLGDYSWQGSPGLIMAPDHGNGEDVARRQRAVVKGRRLVLVQEIEAGRYLNEAQLKQLTGGDVITAAKLYENECEIMPTHKIVVATNYKPVVRGADHGIWRRIRLVPFLSRIADEQKDADLPAKLRAEASGILAWMVRGCLAWQHEGLAESPQMRDAAAGYRQHEDKLAEFLEDVTEPGEGVHSSRLYKRYQRWCEDRGEKTWTQRALTDALGERGYKAERIVAEDDLGTRKRDRGIAGLRLRETRRCCTLYPRCSHAVGTQLRPDP